MKTVRLLFACLFLLSPVVCAEESSKELLRDGLFEEEVNQDYQKAEAAYRAVAERYDKERHFAGLAIFRLAEIARKSGNDEQAAALYRRVAGEFADREEIAKRAREQLGIEEGDDVRVAAANPLSAQPGNAEADELQRLRKMERDSPDLLNGVGEDGWHPLHKAAASGWTSAVDFLLERKVQVDPRTTDQPEPWRDGYTPLHLAVIHGHLAVVDRLLAAKADPELTVNIKPEDLPLPIKVGEREAVGNWSPLHFAILYQRREIMNHLLKAKAPLAASGPALANYQVRFSGGSSRSWNFSATPLILAVWLNDEIAIQTLIDHGADINQAASEDGETPLLAAIWAHPELVPKLLDGGAKLTDDSIFGRTALHWAIQHCPPPVIRRLIKEGPDVNIRVELNRHSSEDHPTPLEAVLNWYSFDEEQRIELCNDLLEAGARPTPRALSRATNYSYFELMRAFLETGVDPNAGTTEGYRPLHLVRHVEAARILIGAGARLEVKNHDGVTPLGTVIAFDDTPEHRALIDYLLEQGADASVIPALLSATDSILGRRPLLPYVMSRTVLAGKSDPEAIILAFPENWEVMVGEDRVLPGTTAPSLREFLCFNYQFLDKDRNVASRGSSSRRSSAPRVVTDLIIYRPNAQGALEQVAQLAEQRTTGGSDPVLQWGDVVVFRMGPQHREKRQMPLIHHVGGLEPRTVTFKVGSREHKVSIENTHQTASGLELQDHFSANALMVDLSRVVLRRANGEMKTFNLNLTHDPKKIRLMDGDIVEYSLKERKQVDPAGPFWEAYVLFPDRPSIGGRYSKELVLSDHLQGASLPRGRDFSKLEIERMGENGLERIPLDLVAASRSLTDDERTVAKAMELLKTPIRSGDILVIPPKEYVSWRDRNKYTNAAMDPEIGKLVNLVAPARRPSPKAPTRVIPRTSVPSKSSSSTNRTNGRRVVLPPTSR